MKKVSDKAFIVVGCIFCIAVWLYFLWNPVWQAIKSSEIFLIIYYFLYFCFSIFAFIGIPVILQSNFAYFIKTEKEKRNILKSLDDQDNLSDKENKSIWDIYKSTFFKASSGRICTMAEADLYFNTDSVMVELAPRTIKYSHHISETFIGIGVLGTFLGFSIGMKNIDFSNADNMISNIETLIHSGFATAFNTSIVGIICSVIYKFLIYTPQFNTMDDHFRELSDDLDSEYYISSTQVIDAFNSDLIRTLSGEVEEILDIHVKNIGDVLTKTINEEVLNLKEALKYGTSQINEVIDKLSHTPDALEKTYKIIETRSNDLMHRLNTSLNSLSVKIKAEIVGLKESLSSLIEPIKEIESSSHVVLSKYEIIAQKFDDTGNNISTSFAKTQNVIDALIGVDNNIQNAVNSISESLKKLDEEGKQSQKNISSAVEALSKTEIIFQGFNEVDKNLTNIFNNINESTQEYLKSISNTYKEALSNQKELLK